MNYSEQKVISRAQNTGNLVDIVLFSPLWYKGSVTEYITSQQSILWIMSLSKYDFI